MYEVYDLNTKEAIATFDHRFDALDCARDMNAGKLDPLYGVRESFPDYDWDDYSPRDPGRERWGSDY